MPHICRLLSHLSFPILIPLPRNKMRFTPGNRHWVLMTAIYNRHVTIYRHIYVCINVICSCRFLQCLHTAGTVGTAGSVGNSTCYSRLGKRSDSIVRDRVSHNTIVFNSVMCEGSFSVLTIGSFHVNRPKVANIHACTYRLQMNSFPPKILDNDANWSQSVHTHKNSWLEWWHPPSRAFFQLIPKCDSQWEIVVVSELSVNTSSTEYCTGNSGWQPQVTVSPKSGTKHKSGTDSMEKPGANKNFDNS